MTRLCFSSETYTIDLNDIVVLEDSRVTCGKIPPGEVVVLIGGKDSLLAGRDLAEAAIGKNLRSIPVRIAFAPKMRPYDFISHFIRPLRLKYRFYSSNIYHVDPKEIRAMQLERNIRTGRNAYAFTNRKYYFPPEERVDRYEKLRMSMKNGYDDRYPMDIMLLRTLGAQDTLNQGHHRIGIAIECGLERVAVTFSACGGAPEWVRPLFRRMARIKRALKRRS